MSKKIKNVLMNILEYSRLYKITKPFYSGIGHIIMLHSVCPRNRPFDLSGHSGLEITPEQLESVIKYFQKNNYTFLSLDQLYDGLIDEKFNKKFVVMTLDDGYLDNYKYAYPIFKKYSIPFAIYITTGCLDGEAFFWWHPLEELVSNNNVIDFGFEGDTFQFNCRNIAEKIDSFSKICRLIMDSNEKQISIRLKAIFELYGIHLLEQSRQLVMDWSKVIELSRDPLATIGAHTVNHLALNKLSESAVKYEVLESKRIIENHINKKVEHFSYPFGSRNEVGEKEFKILKNIGFKTCATTRFGNLHYEHKNFLEALPRVSFDETRIIQKLNFITSGFTQCVSHHFRKVVVI